VAVLEEVEPDGTSRFVTDNAIRASHRAINNPPFDHFGLPWHGNYEKDAAILPPEPLEIQLDLKPVGIRIEKGNRIRLTIAGADALSGTAPQAKTPRAITIYRNRQNVSLIELPTVTF
jgi:predicted acyl esterase